TDTGPAGATTQAPTDTGAIRAGRPMSALPPKADMDQQGRDVRFVPKADIRLGFGYSAQMILSGTKNSRRVLALLVFMFASLLGLLLLPPIVQDQNYHDFADQRTLFGIPHFWNVVSNIPFIGIGAVGLWQFGRSQATMLLFLGIFLTGLGSGYYHL